MSERGAKGGTCRGRRGVEERQGNEGTEECDETRERRNR